MSLRLDPYLVCNRLVKEEWENREYELHQKRLKEIKNRKTKVETVKFPIIINNAKKIQINRDYQDDLDRHDHAVERKIKKINSEKNSDIWNPDFEKRNIRDAQRSRLKLGIEVENDRMTKKLKNTKGVYSIKKWDQEFENHLRYLKFSEHKFYTPRGMGHRKLKSLPDLKNERSSRSQRNNNTIKMLNQAVNQLDRADVVLMKTLVTLNYYERMETKKSYEEAYQTDLKKGLVKVMDKQFEPLINALLTEVNTVDIDKIYESLYDPHEAAIVIPEAVLSRSLEDRESLYKDFEIKIDSKLSNEIDNKLEGDLKKLLLALIENENLDNDECDVKKGESDAKSLGKDFSFTSDDFLDIIETSSKKQLNEFFKAYQKIHGSEICSESDMNKPICKSVKLIQTFLSNSNLYKTDKIQKAFKSNKPEFLRLLAIQSERDLTEIVKTYNKKSSIDSDVRNGFSEEVSRLILKMIHKNSDE